MSCLVSKGKLLNCKDQKGGIKSIYFANGTADDFAFVITAHQLTSLGTLDEVFKYEVKATTNTLTETGTSSEDNGTFFVAQALAITLPKLSADLQAQAQLICAGRPSVFVEDYNGNIVLVGAYNGTMSNMTKVTGGASGDLSGFTLAINAEEKDNSPFLDSAMKTALKLLVSDVVVS
jgi:hypothetical protein